MVAVSITRFRVRKVLNRFFGDQLLIIGFDAGLADSDEHGRLDVQHRMLRIKMDGLYWTAEAVRPILAPRPEGSEPPAILDIGTGSGSWVVDMARQFPHCDVVGMDLAPANLSRDPPENCRFECDDANLGLSHYTNSFDVVHIRCVGGGINDWKALVGEMERCLKPGGVLLTFGAAGLMMYDESFEPITDLTIDGREGEDGRKFTWMNKYCEAMRTAVEAKNQGSMERCLSTVKWLREVPCWKEIGARNYYIPLGPWEANMTEKERYVAELQRQDFLRVISSFRPLLLAHGYPVELIDQWILNIQDELIHLRKKQYVKWFATWSVKQDGP